jgi:hypothetical protein
MLEHHLTLMELPEEIQQLVVCLLPTVVQEDQMEVAEVLVVAAAVNYLPQVVILQVAQAQ